MAKPELPHIPHVSDALQRTAEKLPDIPSSLQRTASSLSALPRRTAQGLSDFSQAVQRNADTLRRRSAEDARDANISLQPGKPQSLRALKPKKSRKKKRHTRTKVAFFRYGYYDIAFKYFVEQVLDADFIELPESTRRTMELGSLNSNDFVCSPFKHILGNYIEALELGADVLVQFAGPCRLGYYGELQESILRDMGYQFDMLNFATLSGEPAPEYLKECKKKVNPDLSVSQGVKNMVTLCKMVEYLDAYHDRYLAIAGFGQDKQAFNRAREDYYADMRTVTSKAQLNETQKKHLRLLEDIPREEPVDPIRVGIVGEYFTAVDSHANLFVEEKLIAMGVSLARYINISNRNLHYNEENLRQSVRDYVSYDMGPTSTMTIAAAKRYAQEGFDGLIHIKSSGCTPEIDCMPVLQRLSQDFHIPILYLSYDSQTSDTGLDTRLEAFYDMIAMRKAR